MGWYSIEIDNPDETGRAVLLIWWDYAQASSWGCLTSGQGVLGELKLLAQGWHRCALWECFSSCISVIILTASCFSRHSISSMPFFVSCILITSAPHSCHGSKFEWCSNGLINTLYNETRWVMYTIDKGSYESKHFSSIGIRLIHCWDSSTAVLRKDTQSWSFAFIFDLPNSSLNCIQTCEL